nr:hypothetical protein [Gammaproteobacteria bacterium AqS3]
ALSSKPSHSVTVTLRQPANTDVTLDTDTTAANDQNRLTFTKANWNTGQTVTVKAAQDADAIDDTATISLTASGGNYGSVTASVAVTVEDDDAGLVLSTSSLEIGEGGSGVFDVRLRGQPPGMVTVTLTHPAGTDVTLDTDNTTDGNQNSLTFTTSDWNDGKPVTVHAGQDDDASNDSATISLAASGTNFDSATASLGVTVDDDDDKLILSTPSLAIDEGGSKTFKVRLQGRPSASVSVRLTQSGTANPDVTFDTNASTTGNQNTLTFTTSNWSMDKTVRVSAAADDDPRDDGATIKLTASGAGFDDATESVSVTVKDPDTIGLILSASKLTVIEGNRATFTVKLATLPTSNVTVTLNQPGNADVTVDTAPGTTGNQNTLTFTTSDWDRAQTVTANVAEDDDTQGETATINLTASGADYGGATKSLLVKVSENDMAGLVVSKSSVTVIEGGSETFTVKLDTRPSEDVAVTLSQDTIKNDPDVSFDANTSTAGIQTSLQFTPDNWNVARTARVNAVEDNDAIDDEVIIHLQAFGADYGAVTRSVGVTVTDNDTPGLMLSKIALALDEGESGTFTVRLATQPSGSVTVQLTRSGDTDVTVSPASLSFTASSWNRTQTVTVSAAQDNNNDSAQDTATINLTASGGGYGSVTGSVAVKVADDDAVALTLSPSSLTMTEGASKTFNVRLAVNPGGNRTVSLASTYPDVTVSPAVLHFTSNNATAPQDVTVSAVQDDDKIDDTATINLTGTGIRTKSVSVKVLDNDLELVLSTGKLDVTETTSENFTVRLASQPEYSRTVNLTFSKSNPDVSLSRTTLSFTKSNWNAAQTVTVSAANDDDKEDESATIRLSGVGLVAASVKIKVHDDDRDPEFVLSTSLVKLTEQGRQETFKVKLSSAPKTNRSVTLTSANPDVRFVSSTSLTFNNHNWMEDQTVTIKAIGDSDTADESATIKVKSADITTARVTVKITDDDGHNNRHTLELIIPGTVNNIAMQTIEEGSSGTFTVRLSAPPGNTRTANIICIDNPDITLGKTSLTFTNLNWDIPQDVKVSASHDSDSSHDMATVDVRSSGLQTKWVKFRITDDEYVAPPPSKPSLPGPPEEIPNCYWPTPGKPQCQIRSPGVEIQ